MINLFAHFLGAYIITGVVWALVSGNAVEFFTWPYELYKNR
jgi:hypothetical protein